MRKLNFLKHDDLKKSVIEILEEKIKQAASSKPTK